MAILAAVPVVEPIAVADIEALLAAIPPDCELHEPGKDLWKGPVELPSIDLLGDQPNDVGTAARPVATGAIRMIGVESVEDPGPMQKVMNQGVNGDHARADFEPPRADVGGAEQNVGQAKGQHLVRNPVDISQWLHQGLYAIRTGQFVPVGYPIIDPADQVTIGDIPNEQIQAIGHLVEMAVSQPMRWQRTSGNVVRLGAGAARLLVSAVVKMPVALQLRALLLPLPNSCELSPRSPGHVWPYNLRRSRRRSLES